MNQKKNIIKTIGDREKNNNNLIIIETKENYERYFDWCGNNGLWIEIEKERNVENE